MRGIVFSVKYPLKPCDFARDDTSWAAKERERYFPEYKESHQDKLRRQSTLALLSSAGKGTLSNQSQIQRRRLPLALHKNSVTNQTEIVESLSLGITDSGKTVAFLD